MGLGEIQKFSPKFCPDSARFCREIKLHDGVAIFLDVNIDYRTTDVDKFCYEQHFEVAAVLSSFKTILLSIYHSPIDDNPVFTVIGEVVYIF